MSNGIPAIVVSMVVALTGCGGVVIVHGHWHAAPSSRGDSVDPAWRAASDVPHVSVFYDALAPYGVWEEDPARGWIWSPSEAGFVPYARGRWVDTEAGPTFLADEPFGWAVAHYGRWFLRERSGRWYWVPDTRWGPAWVTWRVSHEHVGWSALPPAGWSRPTPETAWHFVARGDLFGPSVAGRTYGARDVPWLVATTRPHPGDTSEAGFIVGPEVHYAGWRAHKVPLQRLPQAKVRWVPRWERGELRRARPSVRAGPAPAERRGRQTLANPWRSTRGSEGK